MSLEEIASIMPLIGCTIVIVIHAAFLVSPNTINHRWEHHCIICAYALFLLHYYIER